MRARWAGEPQTNERASEWMPAIHIHNNAHMNSLRLIHSPGCKSCTHQSVWIMIMVALPFYWLFLWVFICFCSVRFNMIFEAKIKSQLLVMGFEMISINATDTQTIESWLFLTATYNHFITHTWWRVCARSVSAGPVSRSVVIIVHWCDRSSIASSKWLQHSHSVSAIQCFAVGKTDENESTGSVLIDLILFHSRTMAKLADPFAGFKRNELN